MVGELAGRALFIRVLALVRAEDAVPGAVREVDQMLPAVAPQALVIPPVAFRTRARAQ